MRFYPTKYKFYAFMYGDLRKQKHTFTFGS